MKLTQKDVDYIKRITNRHNGKCELFIKSKDCVELLDDDEECIVMYSEYPGENNKYIIGAVKKGNKYVFIENYIM